IPQEWSRYFVLGDDSISNKPSSPHAGAYFCIDKINASVIRLDPEIPNPVIFVNSSVSQFVESFVLLNAFFYSRGSQLQVLVERLRAIDPDSYWHGSCWYGLLVLLCK
ncbi:MAG TPA: SUKH-4 family immunity protein, partial [Candidatus Methylacidiphilales bacterium]|nr:SUKH-4 family immunity protein [Candidatus Methylacidiphilales bacterium]